MASPVAGIAVPGAGAPPGKLRLVRITPHVDPGLPDAVEVQEIIEQKPLTGRGLPHARFGRHPNSDVTMTSAGIPLLLSRQHAVLAFDGESLTVVDLETTNGTYVRGPLRCARAPARALPQRSRTARARASAHAARRAHSSVKARGPVCQLIAPAPAGPSNTRACPQVNAIQLPRNGRRTLRVGDVVSFGGPTNVRCGRCLLYPTAAAC